MTQQKIHGSQIDASDIDLTGVEGSGLQNVDAITLEGSSLADIEQYVDAVAQGLKVAPAVKVATTGPLGGTYTPGPGSPETGVGGTLNLGPLATLDIDDVTTWAFNDGILVKDQANAAENGRYRLSQVGDGSPAVDWILTRCEFCDESTEIPSSYVFVQLGTVNGGTGWVALVGDPATFVVDTDPVTYSQFSGAGTYTGGAGIDVTGTTISIETTGVVANTYGNNIAVPVFAVDVTGRITTVTNTSIRTASTTQTGIVQLNDTVSSTSITQAATANAVKSANDNANTRVPSTRTLTGGTGINTIGDLSVDRTINLTNIAAGSTTTGALFYNGTTSSAGQLYGGTTNPSTTTRLNYNGDFYAYNIFGVVDVTALSDLRLKDNITNIDGALDIVKSLRGVSYTRSDIDDGSKHVGLIAQEVQQVLPEVVNGDNEYLSVAYGNVVAVLIEAIKEQQKQIDELASIVKNTSGG